MSVVFSTVPSTYARDWCVTYQLVLFIKQGSCAGEPQSGREVVPMSGTGQGIQAENFLFVNDVLALQGDV